MTERPAFSAYRARLDDLGFKPSSTLGQNFLLDPTLHRAIADAAAPAPGDLVLEIGVGLGFLTRELASRGSAVVGVEIDSRLFEVASEELAAMSNVRLLLADALDGTEGNLHPKVMAALSEQGPTGALVVCANLPYAVAGPLLASLSALPRLPDRIVVLVQKELAQRLAAPSGGDAFGNLSALLQALFTVERLRDVSPQVFRPRPKVDSSVVLLCRRADAAADLAPAAARQSLQAFLRALFQQRRKVLRTTLAKAAAAIGGTAPDVGDMATARAEQLSVDVLVGLWRRSR